MRRVRIVVGGVVLSAALVIWMLLMRSPFPDQDSPQAQAIRSAVLDYNTHVDERSAFLCNVNVLGFESVADTPSKAYVALDCENFMKMGDGLCLGGGGGGYLDVYSLRSLDGRLEVVDLIGAYEFSGVDPGRIFPPDIARLISRHDERLWPGFDDLRERAEAFLLGEVASEGDLEGSGEPPSCPNRFF